MKEIERDGRKHLDGDGKSLASRQSPNSPITGKEDEDLARGTFKKASMEIFLFISSIMFLKEKYIALKGRRQ